MADRPLGRQTVRVLAALVSGCRYGFDVVHRTGLVSATVYRALRRLEKLEIVRSRWEDPDTAEADNRPRRRYYTLTASGRAAFERIRQEYREELGEPAADPTSPPTPAEETR